MAESIMPFEFVIILVGILFSERGKIIKRVNISLIVKEAPYLGYNYDWQTDKTKTPMIVPNKAAKNKKSAFFCSFHLLKVQCYVHFQQTRHFMPQQQ